MISRKNSHFSELVHVKISYFFRMQVLMTEEIILLELLTKWVTKIAHWL